MTPLTQQEKNKVYEPMYRQLEKLENKMIKHGIDRNDPKDVELNEKWLSEYQEIENTINFIQFHNIYMLITPKDNAIIGNRFNIIPDPLSINDQFEIIAVTNKQFSAVTKNDCTYVLCKYIGDNRKMTYTKTVLSYINEQLELLNNSQKQEKHRVTWNYLDGQIMALMKLRDKIIHSEVM